MCQYTILSQRENAIIRYCNDCKPYILEFSNILINFESQGFEGFKHNLGICYETNTERYFPEHRDIRDIRFNTKIEGLQLLFSLNEIGVLLAMMQEAQLSELTFENSDTSHQ